MEKMHAAEVKSLRQIIHGLARLGHPEPQFFNPVEAGRWRSFAVTVVRDWPADGSKPPLSANAGDGKGGR